MNWQAFLEASIAFSKALISLLTAGACVLAAAWIAIGGLRKLASASRGERQGQGTAGPVAINFFIAALLAQLSTVAGNTVEMMFGTGISDPREALSYMPSQVAGNETLMFVVSVAVYWLAALGWVAVFRGLLLWNSLSEGQAAGGRDLGWRGFWHLLGGSALINIGGLAAGWFGG
ncbi:hypothetical protein [Cupriavidus sp. TMH.W2]|uniref:hypothetical protein n=1 Tax=Cupriavidus sp. TMH.W2 TaxID=3434465 RepID=UPI003D7781A7